MTTTVEARWRQRFRAPRITRPVWARDAPQRLRYLSTEAGKTELVAWDRTSDSHRRVTDRPEGTTNGRLDPTGERIWWFADERGSERGGWMVQPFGGGEDRPATPDLPPHYSVGLALGRDAAVLGTSTDDGSAVYLVRPEERPRLLYAHQQLATVAGLSRDDRLFCIAHAEHGDAQHRALRVLDLAGGTIGDLWDGPGLDLTPAGWSPVAGDQRLLVIHERHGEDRPLIWNLSTGAVHEPAIALTGEIAAGWYADASALLLVRTDRGRGALYRLELESGALTALDTDPGVISDAVVRPDGEIWYGWTAAATPPEVRGRHGVLLRPQGDAAPGGVPYSDLDVGGVHGFLAEPPGERPHPTIFQIHGGPTSQDMDAFSPRVQAWVDHGHAVVLVNYRGSTGYGRTWRDALIGNPGFIELEDIAAVHDHVTKAGIADPRRVILAGGSWGGYLALLGLGTQPERWSLGIADVPVADWFGQIEDEMEPLRRYDEALFGGKSIAEFPEVYRRASPISYVEQLRVPVMIFGGENDPRCPIRPIEAYVARLRELGKPHEYERFNAGHNSQVIDEQIRQMEKRLAFAARHLGTPAPR